MSDEPDLIEGLLLANGRDDCTCNVAAKSDDPREHDPYCAFPLMHRAASALKGKGEECERLKAERDKALFACQAVHEAVVYSDSYGVEGSGFSTCAVCGAGGAPGVVFKHDDNCAVLRAETITIDWYDEHQAELKDYEDRADAAESSLSRMKEALEPFVKLFRARREEYSGRTASAADWFNNMPGEWEFKAAFTMSDFRRAETALSQSVNPQSPQSDATSAPETELTAGWPDPTPEMLNDPTFNAIWKCIKSWDINVPEAYGGYCGATGNHVRAILDAIASARLMPEKEKLDENPT